MLHKPGYPSSDSGGTISEHRYVMEQHLGRQLLPTEVVHHINGVKDDNRVENLEVLLAGAHHSIHMRGSSSPLAKLTDADVLEMRRLYATGTYTQVSLAQRFGLKTAQTNAILRGKAWQHLLP